MPSESIQLDLLRRHAWSHRRAPSRVLRIFARMCCLSLLLLLAALIGLYLYWTEPHRVRQLSEAFLSRVIDGDISIGEARLSIFEGLQLDNVAISLRKSMGGPREAITARRLQISYSPLALLAGKLESGRVIAIEPEVHLTEDVATGRWNLQSLQRPTSQPTPTTTKPSRGGLPPLPEVLIRGGRLDRGQLTADGHFEHLQTVLLEGQLLPRPARGAYRFNLQSRTDQGTAGPAFQGEFSLADGIAQSSLTNVELSFLEPMLPARVRTFWQKLAPTGRVDVPVLMVARSIGPSADAGFRIELQLDNVRMSIRPTDWVSAREQNVLHDAANVSRDLRRLPYETLISTAASIQPQLRVGVVPLEGVKGRFIFTEAGVTLDRLAATIDGNPFEIHGHLGGYALDAPVHLTLASPAGHPIELRETVPYINALPAEIREVYYRFRPRGRTNLNFAIDRVAAGSPLSATGSLEFANAQFVFEQFRYPVRNGSGKLIVDADPKSGETRLVIDDIRGNGPANGPNANGELRVAGVIAPLIGYASVDVDVSGKDIHSEPALIAALPPEAAEVIRNFDDDGPGPDPVFAGDFACRVRREPGPISRWTYDTDISVHGGRGALHDFPYPLEDFSADLRIRKDRVEIVSASSKHGGGVLELSGLSEWGTRLATTASTRPRPVGEPGVRIALTLKARSLPIDDALKNALPPDARDALVHNGIGGTIDITGPITITDPRKPQFDLTLQARDARFAPTDWKTSIDHIVATMQLTPDTLKLDRAVGKRGDTNVTANGTIDWADPHQPKLKLDARADGLILDPTLRESLPTDGRSVWDSLKPAGLIDTSITLDGLIASPTWSIELKPRGASMTPDFLPLLATDVTGMIRANATRIEMSELRGKMGGGSVLVSGVGEFGPRQSWTLAFSTIDTHLDPAFIDALPAALGATLHDSAVAGTADLNFRQLAWTNAPDGKSTDILFDTSIAMRDATWTSGVTIDKATGSIDLRGHFVNDEPTALDGSASLAAFRIAGLDATKGVATIASDPRLSRIALKDLSAKIGDGDIAGTLGLDRSRHGITRWAADLLLRNADVAALTAASENAPKVCGRLNASLSIEGAYGDDRAKVAAAPRRGRGDISVSGDKMVNVPMILGVTQVVSLALPFTGGFNEATASYSLDGDRVTFSDIDLQSNEMKIKGAGWLDFGNKQVSLDFTTDTTGKKLPVIGGLLDAARRELFQIKVRGTVTEPEVKTGSLRTVTTTIDEILGSGEPK